MSDATETARPLRVSILLIIGFGFALLGFLNAMPNFGPLPSIGVIPARVLHPLILAVGLTISFLHISRFSGGAPTLLVTALNAALVAVALYALYDFNVAVTRVEEVGLFFFKEAHAWWTITGCSIIIYYCCHCTLINQNPA